MRDLKPIPRRASRLAVGALAAIGITTTALVGKRITDARSVRAGYVAQVRHDIAALRTAQDGFHDRTGRYGSLTDLGPAFVPSLGVVISIVAVDTASWSAYAAHTRITLRCRFGPTTEVCE